MIRPSPFERTIPSAYIPLQEVATLLAEQARELMPGDMFFLSTHLVERQSRMMGWNGNEYEDVIVSTHYLGIADADDRDFIHIVGGNITGKLYIGVESFVESNTLRVEHGAIAIDQLSTRCTPIDKPIPQHLIGMRAMIEKCPDQYPFMLIVGQEKIEDYVLKHGGSVVEFYNFARRILKLPTPVRQELHDADEEMIRDLILSVYTKWQKMRANNKEIDRIMSLPSRDDRFDKVAAIFISSGHRSKNNELASSIQGKIERLVDLGVKDEHRMVSIDHTPGLSLDVSAFIEWFERHMAKNT